MKPKHQRLVFVVFAMLALCLAVVLTLKAFRENLVFFYSPSDIAAQNIAPGTLIRVGGLVKKNSVAYEDTGRLRFHLTDGTHELEVFFRGLPPGLFREEQGVVAEGYLMDGTHFQAVKVLTKHDEKYMPPEVVDALKRSGRWQEGEKPR